MIYYRANKFTGTARPCHHSTKSVWTPHGWNFESLGCSCVHYPSTRVLLAGTFFSSLKSPIFAQEAATTLTQKNKNMNVTTCSECSEELQLVCQISRGHRMNHCIMEYQWDIGVQLEIFCLFFFLTGMLSDTLQKMPSFPEKYEIPGKKRKKKKTPTPNTHTQVSGVHTTLILAP